MTGISHFLIGFALAMDSAAVSLVGGIAAERHRQPLLPIAIKFALTFGIFQGGMAVAGFFGGGLFAGWMTAVDHWVAFGLLLLIGGNMIREALSADGGDAKPPGGLYELLLAGFATSIDAFAVGISYSLLDQTIWGPALIIAGVTAALCIPAALMGARLGHAFSKRAEVLGGVILIAIGVRILVEHLGA